MCQQVCMTSVFKVLFSSLHFLAFIFIQVFETLSILNLFFNEAQAKILLLSVLISIQLLTKNVEIFLNTGSELSSYRYSGNLRVKVNLQAKCTTIFFPIILTQKLRGLNMFFKSSVERVNIWNIRFLLFTVFMANNLIYSQCSWNNHY